MSKKSSSFVRETREREAWITAHEQRLAAEHPEEASQGSVMSTAALTHGVLEAIEAPEEAEIASRQRALEAMTGVNWKPPKPKPVRAPWFVKVGRTLQTVFTLGKKR